MSIFLERGILPEAAPLTASSSFSAIGWMVFAPLSCLPVLISLAALERLCSYLLLGAPPGPTGVVPVATRARWLMLLVLLYVDTKDWSNC